MNRTTMITLAVFLALVTATLFVTTRSPERNISRLSLSDISVDGITKVVVSGKNEAELNKDGDTWTVKLGERAKRADAAMVTRMLEAVPKIVSSDLVTSTEARFEELEVNEEKGTRVQTFAGARVVADFIVGSAADGGSHIKVGGDVFAVKGVYSSNFARAASAWVDKKIFADKVDDVVSVSVALAGQAPYTLVKKEDKWAVDGDVLPKDFRFDSNAARRIVQSLVTLRAKDVLDSDPGNDKTQLAPPGSPHVFSYTVKEGESEVKREVSFGATEDAAVFASVTGGEDVYTVHESTLKNLMKGPTELREMTMVTLEKDKITKLVVSGDEKITLEKKGADWAISSASVKIPTDFKLDPAAVTRRLSAFANARAVKVAENTTVQAAGLSRPAQSITAIGEGIPVTLAFGRKTKDGERELLYARGNTDDAVYLVTDYMKNNVTGGLKSFEKKNAPPGGMGGMGGMGGLGGIDPAALKNLPPDVRKQLEAQIRQKQQQQQMMERLSKQAAN